MTPREILALLALKGITQTSIAKRCGYTLQAVSQLIRHGIGSDQLREAVAEAVGEDKRQLWPEYYFKKTG